MFSLNQPSSQASRDRGALDGTGYGHGQSLAGGADTMGATKGGVVGCGIGTSLEQHRPDGALSWIRHVTPQGVNR